MNALVFGTASARPGRTAWGQLAVREAGRAVRLPVVVLHGRRPGPHLVFLANQHGEEINGFEAVRRLAAETDPRRLRGTVFAVACMNPRAALAMQQSWLEAHEGESPRYDAGLTVWTNPYNLNGNWPGRAGGTLAQRVVHEVWRRAIWAPHRRADLVLDIHSHQNRTAVYARNPAGAALGLVAGCRFVVISGGEAALPTCNAVCVRHGIMAMTIEPQGQRRFYPDGVADALRAMTNLLVFWKMMPGRLALPPEALVLDPWRSQCPWNRATPRSCCTYYARRPGLCLTEKQAYDRVRRGEVICRILDPFTGREVETCRAPMAGALYMLRWGDASVEKGERLFTVSVSRRVRPAAWLQRHNPTPERYRFQGPAVRQRAFAGKP